MASRFKLLRKTFGFKDGLKLYLQIKKSRGGWFKSDTYRANFFLRTGTTDYDTFEQVFLQKQYDIHIPFQPKYIIDGGANIGLAAIYFAHRFPQANIVCIEPSAENFAQLQINTKQLQQVTCIQAGIWYNDAELEIVDSGADKNAFMVKETNTPGTNSFPAVSIGSIMQKNNWPCIDILKLDIEGAEKELFLENYASWLPKTKVLIIELHDFMKNGCSRAVFNAIGNYNFSFSMLGENVVFTNEDPV